MKTKLVVLAAAVAVSLGAWAAPTVTDITAKQRYPWNGLVDISCKVSGIEADAGGYEFATVAVDKGTGREYTVSTLSIQHNGEEVPDVCDNGDYSLLWNAREDMGQVVIERMAVRVTLEALAASVGKVQLWEGGPYWADRNIGAKKPEDYGLYFWWGDTTGHRPGYNFWVDNSAIYTYNKSVAQLQSAGWVTSGGVLALSHDAAHIKWGGSWRMPTKQEFDDLNSKCDWTLTTLNGVIGYIVRGLGDYASNSIFLPFAGDCKGTSLYPSDYRGCYRSSSVSHSDPASSWYLTFYSKDYYTVSNYSPYRSLGFSIRPVQ